MMPYHLIKAYFIIYRLASIWLRTPVIPYVTIAMTPKALFVVIHRAVDIMHIGICKLSIDIPHSRSLKNRRSTVQSLKQRLQNKFSVSVSEVDNSSSWSAAVIGIACVSNSSRHADQIVDAIISYVESERVAVDIVGIDREVLWGF